MDKKREIHFYDGNGVFILNGEDSEIKVSSSWKETKRRIENNEDIIHTNQMSFLSTKLFEKGYCIFVHEYSRKLRRNLVYEIKLGKNNERTDKEIRMCHNLFDFCKNGVFDLKPISNVKIEVEKEIKDEKEEEILNLKFIDTHAHYNARQYQKPKNKFYEKNVLEEQRKYCKYIINLGTNMASNTDTLRLVSLYDYIYGMLGFFPTDVWQLDDDLCPNDVDMFTFKAKDNRICFEKQLMNQKVVGIGEIGLDYHWDCIGDSRKRIILTGEKARETQRKWFIYQLNLAKEKGLPVSMHSRDAEEDTISIFSDYDEIKGVMHCFSYGMKSADYYLNKGLHLGIGGTSTYPNNKELREVIKECPMDRILLETDAPYLSPQKVRRETNVSKNILYVIDLIAELKGISKEEVINKTNENAINLFGFGFK